MSHNGNGDIVIRQVREVRIPRNQGQGTVHNTQEGTMTISNANEMKGYVVNEGHMEIKNEVRKKKQKQLCERSGNRSHSRNRNRNRHSSRSHSR